MNAIRENLLHNLQNKGQGQARGLGKGTTQGKVAFGR